MHHAGIENTASVVRLAVIQEGSEVLRKSSEKEPLRNISASKLSRFSRRRTEPEPASVTPVKATPTKAQVNDKVSWSAKMPLRLRAFDVQLSAQFSAASRRELRMRATDSLAPPRLCVEGADDVFSVRRTSSLGGFAIISPPKEISATDTLPVLEAVQGVASARHRRPAPLTTRQPSWPPMHDSLRVLGLPSIKDNKDPAPSPPIHHVMAAMREHGQTHFRKRIHEKRTSAASS